MVFWCGALLWHIIIFRTHLPLKKYQSTRTYFFVYISNITFFHLFKHHILGLIYIDMRNSTRFMFTNSEWFKKDKVATST